jgi:transcriptional regulator with XRE-family HTH domain
MTPQELHKHVGIEIKIARLRKGVTTKQLADKMGTGTGAINDIELGKRGARLETYLKIAQALGVELKSLMP